MFGLPARLHRRMPHRLGENHPETIRPAHRKLWLHACVQYVGQAVNRTEVQAAFGFQAACTLCFLAQCPVPHNENANRIISIQGFEPSVELGQDSDLLLHCQPAGQHRAEFFTAATAEPSFRCFPSARLRQYPSNTAQYRWHIFNTKHHPYLFYCFIYLQYHRCRHLDISRQCQRTCARIGH